MIIHTREYYIVLKSKKKSIIKQCMFNSIKFRKYKQEKRKRIPDMERSSWNISFHVFLRVCECVRVYAYICMYTCFSNTCSSNKKISHYTVCCKLLFSSFPHEYFPHQYSLCNLTNHYVGVFKCIPISPFINSLPPGLQRFEDDLPIAF